MILNSVLQSSHVPPPLGGGVGEISRLKVGASHMLDKHSVIEL